MWRHGARQVPSHALLQAQVARDLALHAPPAAPPAAPPPQYEAFVLRGKARAFCTRTPLLSVHECEAAVAAAEAHATAHGGWTASRHYAVPTTDLPVHAVPALLRWFRVAMQERIAPMLAAQFGLAAAAVRVPPRAT